MLTSPQAADRHRGCLLLATRLLSRGDYPMQVPDEGESRGLC